MVMSIETMQKRMPATIEVSEHEKILKALREAHKLEIKKNKFQYDTSLIMAVNEVRKGNEKIIELKARIAAFEEKQA